MLTEDIKSIKADISITHGVWPIMRVEYNDGTRLNWSSPVIETPDSRVERFLKSLQYNPEHKGTLVAAIKAELTRFMDARSS